MNPKELKKSINSDLRINLLNRLPIANANEDVDRAIEEAADNYDFVTDPFIEQQPLYKFGDSLEILIKKGLLHKTTAKLFALSRGKENDERTLAKFYTDFHLYAHQQSALEEVLHNHKNLVVCSGTGSGKTECFLLPLLDYLVREKLETKETDRGVRALLLYPMNALVNDQLRRLRGILKYCNNITELRDNPITFGRFTGETPRKERNPYEFKTSECTAADTILADAPKKNGCETSPHATCINEITKRSQWNESPADILITNYSMLERLLLLPNTSGIFTRGNFWKFIILDEAHSYDGSQGTEIAWLIRRLRQRITPQGELHFLATSATLIEGSLNELKQALKISNVAPEYWDKEIDTARLKTIFIQHAFASQIFPASAESFHIDFGQREDTPEESDYTGNNTVPAYINRAIPQEIIAKITAIPQLNGQLPKEGMPTSLEKFLPWFWGVENFWRNGKNLLSQPIENNGDVLAGDALQILKAMLSLSATLQNKELKENEPLAAQLSINSIFSSNKQPSLFSWLLLILAEHIAPLCKDEAPNWNYAKKKWSTHLHDQLDTAASLKARQEEGNRQFLLEEWVQLRENNLTPLSVQGLEYLLSIGHECMLSSEKSEYSPISMPLYFTDELQKIINDWKNKIEDICSKIKTINDDLKKDIQTFFNIPEYPDYTIEQYLGHVLLAPKSDYLRLRSHIQNCHSRANNLTPAHSEFSQVAETLYPNHTSEEATIFLNNLNTAASFGKTPEGARPLWDIRYHQMIRGVPAATIQFAIEKDDSDNPATEIRLSHPKIEFCTAILNKPPSDNPNKSMEFTLGRCYKCALPYIIGYANSAQIPPKSEGLQLYPYSSENHEHIHALSWCDHKDKDSFESKKPDTAKKPDTIFLDPYKGKIYKNPPQDKINSLIYCTYYANKKSKNNIEQCPCCNGKETNTENSVISAYSSIGDSNKTIAIAAILKELPLSSDPEARSYPGGGRKLITFSDSRKAASTLALKFDKYITERNSAYLLYKALRAPDKKGNDLRSLASAFLEQIKCYGMEDQYLLLDYEKSNPTNRNKISTSPMTEEDAAIALIIQAMRRTRRNNIFEKAGGVLDYQNREKLIASLNDKSKREQYSLNRDKADIAFKQILFWLFRSGKLLATAIDDKSYPDSIINPGNPSWYKEIYKKQKTDAISFEKSTKLNNLMLDAFEHPPKKNKAFQNFITNWLMDTLWEDFTTEDFIREQNDHDIRPLCPLLHFISDEEGQIPSDEPFYARIEEHSAQIESKLGNSYQNAFSAGKINILSCSTTFEMGVDLGDLSCVFLSNQPPSAANYKQRAGRAGRRAGMGAMVWTFIGTDAHDSYYFEHPADMFFGSVQPPLIYLNNPVFRARHLRAEALHSFLEWKIKQLPEEQYHSRWKSVGWFFFGISTYQKRENGQREERRLGNKESDCWLSHLEEWAEEKCSNNNFENDIIAITGENFKPNYNVAKDLVWQLTGTMPPYEGNITPDMYYTLSGPNMGDHIDLSLRDRMHKKLAYLDTSLEELCQKWPDIDKISSIKHLLHGDTIDYLATNRILPLYGFPSNVVELEKDEQDKKITVDLSRDMQQGIYEYAPGRSVIANKRVFISEKPIFYNLPRAGAQAGTSHENLIQRVCSHCGHFGSMLNGESCCDHPNPINALRPDAFKSRPSASGQSYRYLPLQKQDKTLPGKTKNYYTIEGTGIKISENEEKKVIYLNTNNGQGFQLEKYYSEQYDLKSYALIHTVHTDVLKLQFQSSLFEGKRKEYAWRSVAAALQAAMHIILQVQTTDIGVIPDPREESWALFDTSSGGSGFIYQLLLSKETASTLSKNEVSTRIELIKNIIQESIEICKGKYCSCYKNWDKSNNKSHIPGDLGDVIDNNELYRERYNCYSCLRNFHNRSFHMTLDVADAVTLLEAMLKGSTSK